METEKKSVYAVLSAIDCRKESKKKNGLTYLPWAWAWARVKENFPGAFYTIYENRDGLNYHHDGKTAWVKTGVTIEGLEHIEYLPVMNHANKSIPLDMIDSFSVNKSIQRSLTKACARHGLGLYIFAGEDIPEGAEDGDDPAPDGARNRAPTPAPTALKEKAKAAWSAFKELESVKSMDENSRSKLFFATLKAKVGKDNPAKLTEEDWDKMIAELRSMKAN